MSLNGSLKFIDASGKPRVVSAQYPLPTAVTDPAVAADIIPILKGMLTLLAAIAANTAPTP